MARVASSRPRARSRSTSVMSALLPMLTTLARPRLRAAARSRMAVQSAPDWEKTEMPPALGILPAKEAFRAQAVLINPRQLGPSSRTRRLAQMATICRSRASPAGPVSLKPALITTKARAPAATASRTAATTVATGTTITTRSTALP